MPKYLIQGNYVGDGIGGLLADGGTGRRAAVEALAESLGATVESVYYAFGETDVYVVIDAPDNVTVAAAALAASASGAVAAKTTVLLTPEEIDEAAKKTPQYRPPGG